MYKPTITRKYNAIITVHSLWLCTMSDCHKGLGGLVSGGWLMNSYWLIVYRCNQSYPRRMLGVPRVCRFDQGKPTKTVSFCYSRFLLGIPSRSLFLSPHLESTHSPKLWKFFSSHEFPLKAWTAPWIQPSAMSMGAHQWSTSRRSWSLGTDSGIPSKQAWSARSGFVEKLSMKPTTCEGQQLIQGQTKWGDG